MWWVKKLGLGKNGGSASDAELVNLQLTQGLI